MSEVDVQEIIGKQPCEWLVPSDVGTSTRKAGESTSTQTAIEQKKQEVEKAVAQEKLAQQKAVVAKKAADKEDVAKAMIEREWTFKESMIEVEEYSSLHTEDQEESDVGGSKG